MLKKAFLLSLALPGLLLGKGSEKEVLQRIDSHTLIEDYRSALIEAENGVRNFPNSKKILISYLKTLANNLDEMKTIKILNKLVDSFEDVKSNRDLLEEISWGVLNKGLMSTQYNVRLSSMIGAFLTRDVKTVNILISMMRDSNAILRSIAVQLACQYMDKPLQNEIARLMDTEKVWLVKLEVMHAIGVMKIKEKAPKLKEIIASEKTTFEEKKVAIKALSNMYESVDLEEIKTFSNSSSAGLRLLACELAAKLEILDAKDEIIKLIKDPITSVRIAALNSIFLYYFDRLEPKEFTSSIIEAMGDTDPNVSITACFLAMQIDPLFAKKKLKKWLFDEHVDNRRLASAVVASLGEKGVSLAKEAIDKSSDVYVKANVAIGLIGQRIHINKSCDIIYDLLENENNMWMMDTRKNPLFQVLCPSEIRHIDQIPHYPEAIDQMTRLNLLSMLAILEDNRAEDAIKSFLRKKMWGITGVAAATLLQEGDDQSLSVIRKLLDEKDDTIRIQAALVLAIYGKDETVLPILESAYKTAPREMKMYILEALGHIGGINNYSFFIDTLNEPFQILRIANASSLIQCLNK